MKHILAPDIWKPIGGGARMQISADIQKAIVFFGVGDERNPCFGGTGFMLTYKGWSWLVTANHVAKDLGSNPFWVRGNWGKPLHVDGAHWHQHPDPKTDVAIAPFSVTSGGVGNIPEDALLTENIRPFYDVELGNFAYTIGLLRFLPGESRSMSVVHTGFIARLPDDKEPLRSNNSYSAPAYLVQSPHLDGLSGAPVFVRKTHHLTGPDYLDGNVAAGEVALMGLLSSSWYVDPHKDLGQPNGVKVPVGFGVVIPAERIVEAVEDHLNKNLSGPPDEVLAEGDTAFKKPERDKGDEILGKMLNTPPNPK